jgi:predicted YcjX-like family ATPase
LRACRDERFAMSLLPPGRFLMPGNLAGSPALTFAPLDVREDGNPPDGSLWAMMRRRYQSYKDVVVRPFFRDHFARLDRQVVLVDALAAFNSGPNALFDLEAALAGILDCFHIGRGTFLNALFRPRIDRILFAATKADHLHHSSHDRLEAVLRRAVARAVMRAEDTGATIDVVALAAVRATREAQVTRGRESLPSILGTPIAGEKADGEVFDGNTEVATFPGELPEDPQALFEGETAFSGLANGQGKGTDFRFLRFRPPRLAPESENAASLPHIRLDRALQFLIGDRLQ